MNDLAVSDTGIEGQVMIGPIRPVERPGIMNQRPHQATVTVVDQNGQPVAQVHSGTDGQFRIPLKPGTYIMRPESPGNYPRAPQHQVVTVIQNRFTHVTLAYDSGIR
ncbi:MAG: carboxypeptidase regulatory-like domain-containing protein [Herpetosiphonaceae bacterium]|nr:carboxypeptidase regulatory-like domain-containing protein [Herpetosiphonaceae bacterium]